MNFRHIDRPANKYDIDLPQIEEKEERHKFVSVPKKILIPYAKTIAVFKNGEQYEKGIKVILNRQTAQTFEQVLNDIGQTVKMNRGGGVRKLYTMKGRLIKSLPELLEGEPYVVACGSEKFHKLPYLIEETMDRGPKLQDVNFLMYDFQPTHRVALKSERKQKRNEYSKNREGDKWAKTTRLNKGFRELVSRGSDDSSRSSQREEQPLKQISAETLYELFADNDSKEKKSKLKKNALCALLSSPTQDKEKYRRKKTMIEESKSTSQTSSRSLIYEENVLRIEKTAAVIETNPPRICIDSPRSGEDILDNESFTADDILNMQTKAAEKALEEKNRQAEIRRRKLLERNQRKKATENNAEAIIEKHSEAITKIQSKLAEEKERQRELLRGRIEKRKMNAKVPEENGNVKEDQLGTELKTATPDPEVSKAQ